MGPGIQPHSRPSPSRDVLDMIRRHTKSPHGLRCPCLQCLRGHLFALSSTHGSQPPNDKLRIETTGPKVHAEKLPHRDDLAACWHGSVAAKCTGRMKRRVEDDGRGVGVGASATVRDEFMAEDKSPCRWFLWESYYLSLYRIHFHSAAFSTLN